MPSWMTTVWAVGVWGALLGTVLLLLRRSLAAPVFIALLLAYVISLVYACLIAPMPDMNTQAMLIVQGVILAGCVFFAWHAMVQARTKVLR